MFFTKRAPGTTVNDVQVKETESIHERRRNQGVLNHDDFAQLASTLDIPDTQRSAALRTLLERLNDPEQTKRWQEHAQAHPDRKGIANFMGLALSGGGIRSATFNLGVLQVLAWTRLLKFVDYLSTVSGGGYIGSCVSSMFATPLQQYPFEHKQGQVEGAIFRHLRNNAEYLAPHGVADYLRIPMTALRGMVVNLLVLLPYLIVAALVTALMHPTPTAVKQHVINQHVAWMPDALGDSFVFSKSMLAIVLASFILYPIVSMFRHLFSVPRLTDWRFRNTIGRAYGFALLACAAVAFCELQPVALNWIIELRADSGFNLAAFSAGLTAAQSLIPALLSVWLMKNANKLLAKYALTLVGLTAMAAFWVIYLCMCVWLIEGQYATSWITLWPTVAAAAALFAYGIFFVDVNHTSVHGFYRDKLSAAYIVKQAPDGKLEENDGQLLSTLNTAYGPYHLINAAINLRHTKESYRRGRQAESFIFSKHFVGSEPTGYCPTTTMESQSSELGLATAMAISGAAAAPNMGKQTNRLFAFFLAMINVRLNYWLPNPRYSDGCEKGSVSRGPMRRVGPHYLMRELMGKLTDNSLNISLSDGGHYDNMGLYELFRRECRFIVCGDGECDPHLQFNGLTEALRMAQIDFGIIVEMEGLDALRAGDRSHAIGKIRYSNGRVGWLLYLKQSLGGDDSLRATLGDALYQSSSKRSDCRRYDAGAYVAEYKSRNADFPHQSTGDQFFDEAQFECTRAVGYSVAYRTLCT